MKRGKLIDVVCVSLRYCLRILFKPRPIVFAPKLKFDSKTEQKRCQKLIKGVAGYLCIF